jgi:hypothetical protein
VNRRRPLSVQKLSSPFCRARSSVSAKQVFYL